MASINLKAGNHVLAMPPDYVYINTNQLNVICDATDGPINIYLPDIKNLSLSLSEATFIGFK